MMKLKSISILILLCSAVLGLHAQQIETISVHSDVMNCDIPNIVILPADYDSTSVSYIIKFCFSPTTLRERTRHTKMDNKNGMTRREALKRMGTVAMSAALATSGFASVSELTTDKRNMKIVAINGSSRKDGNTADMLRLVLGELEAAGYDTELIQLAGETINPCKACFACAGKKNCVFSSDVFQSLYQKMVEADAIILGSSTYSADVSSTLKAVIERASVVSDTNPGMFRHKIGGAVAVARRAGAMNTIDSINHFFLNKEMFVAGSTYWNIAYGRLPGEALNDDEAVANMKNLGKNIAWFLNRTNQV